MKSLTRGHLKAGLDSMRGAKLRNFWTMLGVIIGVTSIISIIGLSEGIKQQIGDQFHQFGKDLIIIQPAQLHAGPGLGSDNDSLLSAFSVSGSLDNQDLQAVSRTYGVTASSPLSLVPGTVWGQNGPYRSGLVFGTTSALPGLINQSLAYGAFFDDDSSDNNVAVIGQQAAERLFNEDVPLGQSLTFRGQHFVVRGIFNDFNAVPLSQEANYNDAIFIPYAAAQSLTHGSALTYEILAKPHTVAETAVTIKRIQQALKTAQGGISNATVSGQSQAVANSNAILEMLTHLIVGVAAISLIVGGIGIMNVMLVSVAERTHEIGIRKAVGATNSQILSQFMIEASVLSLAGGICGVALSYFIDLCLWLLTSLTLVISWQIVLLATGVSLCIGIVFGSIPALKAARKDPIEALRAE